MENYTIVWWEAGMKEDVILSFVFGMTIQIIIKLTVTLELSVVCAIDLWCNRRAKKVQQSWGKGKRET